LNRIINNLTREGTIGQEEEQLDRIRISWKGLAGREGVLVNWRNRETWETKFVNKLENNCGSR
jgi:hypothetical protein